MTTALPSNRSSGADAKPLDRGAPHIMRHPSFALRFATMSKIAIRMMFYDKLKLLGTLFGVVFAVVLSNQQAGILLGLISKNIMFVENVGADLWVVPASTETLQAGKPVSTAAMYEARVLDGVAWTEPLLYGAVTVSLPGGGSEPVSLVGTRAPDWHGGPWNLVAGSAAALGEPDTMIFEDSERVKLGGLNIGSVREVGGHRAVVGGFTWGLLPFGPSYAFADYDFARTLLHFDADQASFILVGLKPGADPEAVRAALQTRVPEQRVLTGAEFRRRIVNYLLIHTGMGVTFGTSTAFGLIVGLVIVSLSMFSAVVDNIREFGTLKAIGTTNGELALILIVQSTVFAVLGSVIGLGVVSQIGRAMRSPKLALVLPWQFYAGSVLVMIGLCAFASMLALLRLRKVEPAMVFR